MFRVKSALMSLLVSYVLCQSWLDTGRFTGHRVTACAVTVSRTLLQTSRALLRWGVCRGCWSRVSPRGCGSVIVYGESGPGGVNETEKDCIRGGPLLWQRLLFALLQGTGSSGKTRGLLTPPPAFPSLHRHKLSHWAQVTPIILHRKANRILTTRKTSSLKVQDILYLNSICNKLLPDENTVIKHFPKRAKMFSYYDSAHIKTGISKNANMIVYKVRKANNRQWG